MSIQILTRADMTGRTPAQSPAYQYNVGFNYDFIENWTFKTNVDRHGIVTISLIPTMQRSDPYALVE